MRISKNRTGIIVGLYDMLIEHFDKSIIALTYHGVPWWGSVLVGLIKRGLP